MIYNDFRNLKLSSLGLGTMRLPQNSDNYSDINIEETKKMVKYALDNGINYFDTAFGYHDGNSEIVCGKVLSKYPRDSYYLATKFPGYDLSNMDKVEEIFEKQLEKCKVEYFDFYLFHNVYEKNIDPYLDEKYHILPYLLEQKKNGRIKHLGFSAHGCYDVIKRFLDTCGEYMEFCQIQLNYVDWNFQDAKAKVELLNSYNIPIWVMEPVRGGKLTTLPDDAKNTLKNLREDATITEWAFRFLQSVKGVTMVLSGMSNMEQLKENISTFSTYKPLNENEFDTLVSIADKMVSDGVLPCTACRYCTSHCPKALDIPNLLSLYNEHKFTGGGFIAPMAVDALDDDKKPNSCIGCRSCEAVCPQQIKISEVLKEFSEMIGLK
ncbi:MAG: aldo/keto reductase [Lachnospirales bacterium]